MATLRWSALMLLASMILLYWKTSSAWSHYSTNPSSLYRVKRDLSYGSKDKAANILNTVKDSLSLFNDVMGKIDTSKLSSTLKGLSSFASLAPGVGALASSIINLVLAFIPEENPVMNEVKKGFAEVNRKLDSLSIQISNLATDVEWFNYASVYSQDEVRILNAWRKFNEFNNAHGFTNFNHLAEIFVNYYEYTQAEASVANLYHYLTVSDTSLSENLNNLLKRKFKCDIGEISKYNLYFSSLLWKGMVLNEVYWKLIGLSSSGKEAEHSQMFKNVYEAQWAVVDYCLKNHERYVRADVEEISKALSPDNKQVIANQVKKALDRKYSWYNWVVLVYNTDQDRNHLLYKMIKLSMGTIIVAVDYTLKGESNDKQRVVNWAKHCYENKECQPVERCSFWPSDWGADSVTIHLENYAKVPQVAYEEAFVEVPAPIVRVECKWENYISKLSVHYSRKLSFCSSNTCENNGICRQLLDSNEWLCTCQDGYGGDRCERKINLAVTQEIKTTFPLPTITNTNGKLKLIESKLDTIIQRCQGL